jgi:hypothetical protein
VSHSTRAKAEIQKHTVSCTPPPVEIFTNSMCHRILQREYSLTLYVVDSSRGNIFKHYVTCTPSEGIFTNTMWHALLQRGYSKTLLSHALF